MEIDDDIESQDEEIVDERPKRMTLGMKLFLIIANPAARLWVMAGNEVCLHAWGKRGKRGQRKTWQVEPEWITADQFTEAT